MSHDLDVLREDLERTASYLREDFRRELHELKEEMERLRNDQAATDRFLRGGDGGRGLAMRVTELSTSVKYLEKRLNRGRAKGWAIIIVVFGSALAALKKLVGASP